MTIPAGMKNEKEQGLFNLEEGYLLGRWSMTEKLYYGIYNMLYPVILKASTTEATTEAETIITKNDKLSKLLESSNNTAGITSYIMDILYILVVLVIALAFLTILMYIYRYIKRKKDPHYKKNDDDFLDN